MFPFFVAFGNDKTKGLEGEKGWKAAAEQLPCRQGRSSALCKPGVGEPGRMEAASHTSCYTSVAPQAACCSLGPAMPKGAQQEEGCLPPALTQGLNVTVSL